MVMAELSPEALATLDKFTSETLMGGAAVSKGEGSIFQCWWNTWDELQLAGFVTSRQEKHGGYVFDLTAKGIAYKRMTDPGWRTHAEAWERLQRTRQAIIEDRDT